MNFDYTKSRATATRLIKRFGKDVTLHSRSASGTEYDPTIAETTPTLRVVDLNRVLATQGNGGLVVGSRRTLLAEAKTGVTPKKDDEVEMDGVKHTIDEARPLSPGTVTILWELDLKA